MSKLSKHLASVPAYLASALPLSNVVAANLGRNTMNWLVVVRLLLVGWLFTACALFALRWLVSKLTTRVILLTTFLLLISFYGFLVSEAQSRGWSVDAKDAAAAAGYTAFAVGVALLAARPWRPGRRDPVPMAIVVVAVFAVNLYVGGRRVAMASSSDWLAAADRFAAIPPAGGAGVAAARRDIYYVVLDAFGRADTLDRLFGADLGGFVGFLQSRGFFVADRARSNYAQTYLTIASILNLNYLDELAAAAGEAAQDYAPLDSVIQRSSLMALARRAGYEVIGIGSDYQATLELEAADRCYCALHGLDGYTRAVIAATPLAALSGDRAYAAHRDKVLASFDALDKPNESGRPRFVFAHILSPHPPFIFTPTGLFRPPTRMFTFADGDDFPGPREEYVRGYRDQALFVANRISAFVTTATDRSGPKPVIVIHGDHGPGSMLHWEAAAATDMEERMNIFAAYLFPEEAGRLYSSITPINGARILAAAYLNTPLPRLPDDSAFSTASHPYRFIPVPSEANSPVQPLGGTK